MLQKLLLLLLFFIVVDSVFSQESVSNLLEVSTRDVVIVQDFDEPEGAKGNFQNITWSLEPSLYITRTDEKPYPQQARVKAYPDILNRTLHKEDKDTMKVLAVRAAFNKKGYNYLELIPHENAAEPREVDKEDNTLPGIYFDNPIIEVGVYVWGSKRDYTLEAEFETTRGTSFSVSFGSLNFQGWKSLKAAIPTRHYRESDLVQKSSYVVKLNKLRVRTSPTEQVDDFIVYFDTLFVTESITRLDYDGRELGEKRLIDTIEWVSHDDEPKGDDGYSQPASEETSGQ